MKHTNLILDMPEKIRNMKLGEYSISFLISLLFHSGLFLAGAYFYNLHFEKPIINSVYLTFQKIENTPDKKTIEETLKEDKKKPEELISQESAKVFYSFNKTDYDTSDIKQVYKESTLNVSVRYPNGWTYIDQNVKKKLDGVTFWAVNGNYETPPYVHIEVKDKYIFNASRFKHKLEHKGNIYYYNNPEEMKGYFAQIIYIRTDSDEDYSIKLMVKGKETFQSFQPVFFNMAKSFSFGKSFL